MSTPTADETRQQFIDFFVQKAGHTAVPSSPVVPHDDPTLLFTNAGMNQFKDVFLGTGSREYTRAVDTQKCIRAGGKHNDLDDVGKDTYHHTFFEMLGNWSFGDYFKAEAIDWAWELLTSPEWWNLDPKRLHATYFEGDAELGLEPDHEARDLWLEKLPGDRVHPGNKKDNFWEMGDTGPCGPCSELHYDRSSDYSGGGLVNADGQDIVVEIWNLVFIQYNRLTTGGLEPLPAKHVDTGMGFERIVRVLQGKDSNYDTDVFKPIFAAIRDVTGAPAYSGGDGTFDNPVDTAYRVIADHIRTLTFALADGAHCSNEGRGYVLRRILRRAVRYGRQTLEVQEPFFYKLVPNVVGIFKEPFPELEAKADAVMAEIKDEEISFNSTIDRGTALFTRSVRKLVDAPDRYGDLPDIGRDLVKAIERQFSSIIFSDRNDDIESKRMFLKKLWFIKHPQIMSLPEMYTDYSNLDQLRVFANSLKEQRNLVKELLAFLVNEIDKIQDWPIWKDVDEVSVHDFRHNILIGIEQLKAVDNQLNQLEINKNNAFQLHDTFGFPLDLTQLMADEIGIAIDVEGFNQLMEEARKKARAGSSGGETARNSLAEQVAKGLDAGWFVETNFTGHDVTEAPFQANTLHLFKKVGDAYESATTANAGDELAVVLQMTPFYAEAGGQVGDTGTIMARQSVSPTGGQVARLRVNDTIKVGDVHLHLAILTAGTIEVVEGQTHCALAVDAERRALIRKNHTATHVMNRALRDHVNPEADQKGSLVDDEKLRFDFSHGSALTPEEIVKVENQVNADIEKNLPVFAEVVPQEQALRINGLRAVFGEKYPPNVRVVSVGVPVGRLVSDPENKEWTAHSIEFCGGAHAATTGEAEAFCVVSQEAVSKGVRRVTALTGPAAKRAQAEAQNLTQIADELVNVTDDSLPARVEALNKDLESATLPLRARGDLREKLAELGQRVKTQQKAAGQEAERGVVAAAQALAEAEAGPVIVADVPGADGKTLRTAMDVVRKKHPDAALFLAAAPSAGGKVAMIAAVPPDAVAKGLKAGDWIKHVAPIVGGGGGGRPDLAQAGGKDAAKLPDALAAAQAFAQGKV